MTTVTIIDNIIYSTVIYRIINITVSIISIFEAINIFERIQNFDQSTLALCERACEADCQDGEIVRVREEAHHTMRQKKPSAITLQCDRGKRHRRSNAGLAAHYGDYRASTPHYNHYLQRRIADSISHHFFVILTFLLVERGKHNITNISYAIVEIVNM